MTNLHAPLVCLQPHNPIGLGMLRAMRAHPALARLIVVDCSRGRDLRDRLRTALIREGPPPADLVAGYITSIRGGATFGRAVRAELTGEDFPKRSARHSALKKAGPLTGAAWSALFTLITALCTPDTGTTEQAAGSVGVDPRTLRAYSAKLLHLDWQDARLCFGWRWAIDRTLQVHGYIPKEQHIPLAIPERPPRPQEGRHRVALSSE